MNVDPTIISLIIAIVGAALGLWWRIEARVTFERLERQETIQRLSQDFTLLRDRFNAFELESVKQFVPAAYQEKMETRFIGSMDKLAARLETVLTRMEGLGNEIVKIKTVVTKVEQVVGDGTAMNK